MNVMDLCQLLIVIGYLCICSHCYLYTVLQSINVQNYPENITFRLIVENFKGSLFYSDDSHGNYINVALIERSNGYINISFNHNNFENAESLTKFCGCVTCKNEELTFVLYNLDKKIHFSCNGRSEIVLHIKEIPGISSDINISMGYNPPSLTSPTDAKLIGCLVFFLYKNKTEDFSSRGDGTFSRCPQLCTGGICNTGICIKKYSSYKCNCALSIQNGRYCNETGTSLNGSQRLVWNGTLKFRKLKFSWVQTNLTKFILFEIHTKNSTVLIYTKNLKTITMKSGKREDTLCEISNGYTQNIIFLGVSSQYYTVECYNSSKKSLNISQSAFLKFFVGFAQHHSNIDFFKGTVDLVYQDYTDDAWIRPTLEELEVRVVDIQGFVMEILKQASIYAVPVLASIIILITVYFKFQGRHNVKTKSKSKVLNQKEIDTEELVYDELQSKPEHPYDSIDYNKSNYNNSTNMENEYMAMSPTLPQRNRLQITDDYYPASSDHIFAL